MNENLIVSQQSVASGRTSKQKNIAEISINTLLTSHTTQIHSFMFYTAMSQKILLTLNKFEILTVIFCTIIIIMTFVTR